MNLKKVYRLYLEGRLTVRKRGGRKRALSTRALSTRAPMGGTQEGNQRWSLDFVSDALASGRQFRLLNVLDDYIRKESGSGTNPLAPLPFASGSAPTGSASYSKVE